MKEKRYAKTHEWFCSTCGKIGISDYAQKELGDIVYVELPEVGAQLEQGKSFAVVESVKAASDIYAPVSGTVIEINDELVDTPELINKDAEKAWFVKVEGAEGVESLLSYEAYSEFIK